MDFRLDKKNRKKRTANFCTTEGWLNSSSSGMVLEQTEEEETSLQTFQVSYPTIGTNIPIPTSYQCGMIFFKNIFCCWGGECLIGWNSSATHIRVAYRVFFCWIGIKNVPNHQKVNFNFKETVQRDFLSQVFPLIGPLANGLNKIFLILV